jgi:hypothetical protein
MIRRLFSLLALLGLAALVRMLLRRSRRAGQWPVAGARPGAPRFEGALVRDRVCGTFLPRSRALVLRDGGGESFFCSEGCRETHLSRLRPAKSA